MPCCCRCCLAARNHLHQSPFFPSSNEYFFSFEETAGLARPNAGECSERILRIRMFVAKTKNNNNKIGVCSQEKLTYSDECSRLNDELDEQLNVWVLYTLCYIYEASKVSNEFAYHGVLKLIHQWRHHLLLSFILDIRQISLVSQYVASLQ